MALYLKALMKCDVEGCDYSEDVDIKFDLADGAAMFMVSDMPAPPNWECFVRLGRKFFRCPDCIAERKRNRLKVVHDAPTAEAQLEGHDEGVAGGRLLEAGRQPSDG